MTICINCTNLIDLDPSSDVWHNKKCRAAQIAPQVDFVTGKESKLDHKFCRDVNPVGACLLFNPKAS